MLKFTREIEKGTIAHATMLNHGVMQYHFQGEDDCCRTLIEKGHKGYFAIVQDYAFDESFSVRMFSPGEMKKTILDLFREGQKLLQQEKEKQKALNLFRCVRNNGEVVYVKGVDIEKVSQNFNFVEIKEIEKANIA